MGHDAHFLTRLSRVQGVALDMALGLYRDPALLRFVIHRLKLPERGPVAALPLTGEEAPPFAIVSLEGKFITCLGAGMRPTEAHVVSWAQLQVATHQLQDWRALATFGRRRQLAAIERFTTCGPWLSREVAEDILIFSSLTPKLFTDEAWITGRQVLQFRDAFRPADVRKLTPEVRDRLVRTWRRCWLVGHAAVIGLESHLRSGVIDPDALPIPMLIDLVVVPAALDLAGLQARSNWMVARMGARILPHVLAWIKEGSTQAAIAGKADFEPTTFGVNIAAAGGLALALRHPEHAPEIEAALWEGLPEAYRAALSELDAAAALRQFKSECEYLAIQAAAWCHLQEARRTGPDHLRTSRLAVQTALTSLITARTGEAERAALERFPDDPDPLPPDLPPGLREAAPLLRTGSIPRWPDLLAHDLHLAPALATRDLLELHPPQAALDWLSTRRRLGTDLGDVVAHLEALHAYHYSTITQPATPGRNEPCTCGSGKKYKKCCGA